MMARRAMVWLALLVFGATGQTSKSTVEYPLLISGPIINVGYATYEGYYNDTYDLNIWKRYEMSCLIIFFFLNVFICLLEPACSLA
jgi:hypothetical protein